MSYAIITGTLIADGNSSWYEGHACNPAQLTAELESLNITGIRTYSCFGRPGEVAGVYPWSNSALPGEYRHTDEAGYEVVLSAADEQRIRDTVLAHVPLPA